LGRVLHFCLGCPGPHSSYFYLPCDWNDRHMPPCPPYLLDGGSCQLLPGLT
jgi:hypothetical protein